MIYSFVTIRSPHAGTRLDVAFRAARMAAILPRAMVLAVWMPVVAAGVVDAEDVVVVRAETGTVRRVGTVVDFTSEGLVLRRGDRQQQIAPADVVSVESQWTEAQQQADRAYKAGQWQEALRRYVEAQAVERRPWVRRYLQYRAALMYRRTGQWDRAAQAFLAIVTNDPATFYYDAIPLVWSGRGPTEADLERLASQWVAPDQPPAAQLIGASWLVGGRQRAAASATLRRLLSSSDIHVAFLAEAQLWRLEMATATETTAERWAERIEKMPPMLRAGPHLIVGRLLSRQKQPEQAALHFLKSALAYPDQGELVAESLLAAAEELEKMEALAEAGRLYSEVMVRFPETQWADHARRWLESHKSKKAES